MKTWELLVSQRYTDEILEMIEGEKHLNGALLFFFLWGLWFLFPYSFLFISVILRSFQKYVYFILFYFVLFYSYETYQFYFPQMYY